MKILTAETDLTSATNISKSPVVRIYNSDSSAITLTRKSNAGTTIGTYSVPSGKVIYCQKTYTDTLEGGAALKATGVGYSEELDIICLGNGGGGSIVDTDLYVYYDFSDTNCWNRQSGTNTDDYTVHNLANDYNDALFRSRTGTSDAYRNASDSPCIEFNSSDGGGCLEVIPSNNSSNTDDFYLIMPGSDSSTSSWSQLYNITPVSATDTNNLMNGIGTGAFTIEIWFKIYLDHSIDYGSGFNQIQSDRTANYSAWYRVTAFSPGFDYDVSRANKLRIGYDTSYIPISGAPSSGAAWSDWNHIVYSRNSDAANDTKIYLNNSLESTFTDNNNLNYMESCNVADVSSPTRFAVRQGIFRFYRGKALTASEVTENWNAQKSRFGY